MSVLTAAVIRRDYLEPSLDALALNDAQDRLIQNDTPEADSLIEHLAALAPVVRETRAVPNLISLFDQAIELRDWNRSEGRCVRTVSGNADTLVTDLRTLELSGRGTPRRAKAIARELREPLRVLADRIAGDARDESVEAGIRLGEIIARTPSAQLFSPAVLRELGSAKAACLRNWHARRDNTAPQPMQAATAPGQTRSNSHAHDEG